MNDIRQEQHRERVLSQANQSLNFQKSQQHHPPTYKMHDPSNGQFPGHPHSTASLGRSSHRSGSLSPDLSPNYRVSPPPHSASSVSNTSASSHGSFNRSRDPQQAHCDRRNSQQFPEVIGRHHGVDPSKIPQVIERVPVKSGYSMAGYYDDTQPSPEDSRSSGDRHDHLPRDTRPRSHTPSPPRLQQHHFANRLTHLIPGQRQTSRTPSPNHRVHWQDSPNARDPRIPNGPISGADLQQQYEESYDNSAQRSRSAESYDRHPRQVYNAHRRVIPRDVSFGNRRDDRRY